MNYRGYSNVNNLTPYYTTTSSGMEAEGIWLIVAAILAVVGGILLYFLFVRSKNQPKNAFLKWLKDFLSFKILWIEAILQITYYIATIFCILGAFAMMWEGVGAFLGMLIGGPILLRVLYEGALILIKIWRNTQIMADNSHPTNGAEIAKNVSSKSTTASKTTKKK